MATKEGLQRDISVANEKQKDLYRKRHKKDLKTRLLARGYPESIINTSFRKADKTDRSLYQVDVRR